MLDFHEIPGLNGPGIKIYSITRSGEKSAVLSEATSAGDYATSALGQQLQERTNYATTTSVNSAVILA